MWPTFIVRVKHDRGTFRLRLPAQDAEAAKRTVMGAEGCPESAIISVKQVKNA
jgi:hypothetical protein